MYICSVTKSYPKLELVGPNEVPQCTTCVRSEPAPIKLFFSAAVEKLATHVRKDFRFEQAHFTNVTHNCATADETSQHEELRLTK